MPEAYLESIILLKSSKSSSLFCTKFLDNGSQIKFGRTKGGELFDSLTLRLLNFLFPPTASPNPPAPDARMWRSGRIGDV